MSHLSNTEISKSEICVKASWLAIFFPPSSWPQKCDVWLWKSDIKHSHVYLSLIIMQHGNNYAYHEMCQAPKALFGYSIKHSYKLHFCSLLLMQHVHLLATLKKLKGTLLPTEYVCNNENFKFFI